MNITPSTAVELIELFVAAAILIWFFYNPWQSLLIDITRQRIFEARDQLFLYAAEGKIDFGSTEYKRIRDFLNLSIRLCHRFSLGSIIASKISNKGDLEEHPQQISMLDTIKGISDYETRRKVENMMVEVTAVLIFFVILRSFLLLTLSVLLVPFILVYLLYKGHIKQLFTRAGSMIERDIRMGGV
ncbi:hypothetical protein ABHF54_13170 [Nitrosomonas europaea]|uniref:hypothetical protein n=1 Tax=Nitrosomonas europaea TaxID=915 RepID=UPI003267032A